VNGLCFNIQRFSIHDGPGIRTTVFLKGCPLHCFWCHNPEGLAPVLQLGIIEGRCVSCNGCGQLCPGGDSLKASSDGTDCTVCGRCADFCPADARKVLGEWITVADLMARIERDTVFHHQSGGGVTFSGGEPLLQHEFLLACLAACREAEIHSAVDTSGYADREVMLKVASRTDLLLFDLKHVDDEQHRQFTGVPVAPILENLRALSGGPTDIWIRIPLIPGFNDDHNTLSTMGRLLAGMKAVTTVSLLPYHKLGTAKYRLPTARPTPPELPEVSPELLAQAQTVLIEAGVSVTSM
jgi:pyruvate formate lyase activating enzyme